MTDPIKKIAFLGTGLMGAPMVLRLLEAGYHVCVWNRTQAKTDALTALGATRGSTPAEAANGCDVVALCLSDALAVEAALFSSEGVARSAKPPPLLVDFSTIGPGPTRELAARLAADCATRWVDAPVSGGVPGAQTGKLVIFCGGSSSDVATVDSLLSALSQRYTRIGDLGAGQTLKLCNQLIVSTNLLAIAESMVLARANGLNLSTLPDALAGGFADSLPMQIFGRRMALGVTTPVLGEIGLMLKDLSAVETLAKADQVELPMMAAALEIYRHAAERGLLREDLGALLRLCSAP
jgi:3-hydroxyisobutyrate dehydrogenase